VLALGVGCVIKWVWFNVAEGAGMLWSLLCWSKAWAAFGRAGRVVVWVNCVVIVG